MNIGIWYSGNRKLFLEDVGSSVPSNMFWGLRELSDAGHNIIELNKVPEQSTFVAGARDLARLYASRQDINACDVVIFYGVQRAALAAALQRLGVIKARIFLYVFGQNLFEMSRKAKAMMSIRLKMVGTANRFGVLSAYELPFIEADLKVSTENFDVVHNGIDINFYRPAKKRPGSLISVGNHGGRDWKMLARAAQQGELAVDILSHRFPSGVSLPPQCRLMKDMTFSDSRDLMASAEIALFPTRANTNFSGVNSLLGSLACGSVVVATDDALCREYGLVHDRNALLIPEGGAAALVREVKRIMQEPERRAAIQAEARRHAERYSMQMMADALMASLHKLAA